MKKSKKIILGLLTLAVLCVNFNVADINAIEIKVSKYYGTNSNIYTLNVPYYNQNDAGAPMGCEAAALLQALHYKNCAKEYNLKTFLKVMPYSKNDNPYEGYSGTPYEYLPYPTYQSIFPAPLTKWANQYGEAVNISGSTVSTLQKEIKAGNPVVVYMSYNFETPEWNEYPWGIGMDNMHVLTLCGYDVDNDKYQVCDPVKGKYWVKGTTFTKSYNYLKWAVSIRTLDLCKKNGHDYGEFKYVVNSSNNSKCDGIKTCKRCGATYKETLNNHDYGEFVVTIKPTATSYGERMKKCNRCGTIYKENLILHVYSDITKDKWYYDVVTEVSKLRLMVGLDNGDFGADKLMNRGMVAIVFHRMEGEKKVEYSKVFSDVYDKQYFTTAVMWSKANSIINGYDSGSFKPLNGVTREEMATIIQRFAKYKGLDVTSNQDISYFEDYAEITPYAKKSLQWCVENGIIHGKYDGTKLDPLGKATRAECSKMLLQAYKIIYK